MTIYEESSDPDSSWYEQALTSWCWPTAAVLHQSFATVAPPVTTQTTAAPHKEPGRPEQGSYQVTSSNGTLCFLASMGIQLNITYNSTSQNKVRKASTDKASSTGVSWQSIMSSHFMLKLKIHYSCSQTLQEIMNIQPNLTNSSGLCDTSSALLKLSTDAEKTNLTFVFTLVSYFICSSQ